VETYLSGPALERAWAASTGITATLPEILSSYETHPRFQAWKQDFLNNFGMALGNIINLLDPHVVILGGGVSNIDWLYTEGREAVYRHCFTDKPDTPIRKHELGDSAGALGAALLARTLI
jgi:fructokinase